MTHTTFAPRNKEQRRVALIEAANTVFAERGYDCATTREIAERAGCAEGLIHRYFAGKRGLMLAILEYKGLQISGEHGATLPDGDSVHAEIEQIMLHDIAAKWERSNFMRICVSQAAIDPEIGAAVRDGVQARQVEFIAAKLRKHQRAGRIRPDVDVEAITHAISGLGFSIGFMYQVAFGGARESAAAIARGISCSPRAEENRS
ncbi:MAG TPA: TetR/AcrR family transcriptional regulator [Dehalococcoidia bacterium]|jgi:AcrR family transcriptional regulator